MNTRLKILFTSSLIAVITLLCSSISMKAQVNPPSETEGKTVIEVVNSNEATSEFAQLLKESGYEQILKKEGTFTVLAPTNEALEKTGKAVKESPKKIVQSHLYKGNVGADQIESQMGVAVEETDESASNGVVHVVDQVVQQ